MLVRVVVAAVSVSVLVSIDPHLEISFYNFVDDGRIFLGLYFFDAAAQVTAAAHFVAV